MLTFWTFQNSVYDFPQPSVVTRKTVPHGLTFPTVVEKQMVELSPLRMRLDRQQKTFSRFMAVP